MERLKVLASRKSSFQISDSTSKSQFNPIPLRREKGELACFQQINLPQVGF
jgi:hypothetical protein